VAQHFLISDRPESEIFGPERDDVTGDW